jgi:hypothetical protein
MRKPHARLWLALLVFCLTLGHPAFSGDTPAQFDPEAKYSSKQLREDFAILRTALEESHAGLYFYSTKKEMDGLFARINEQLDKPMSEPEFLKHLTLLIAGVNDGHTGIRSSQDYQMYLSNQGIIFPFNLRFIKQKAYLFRNYSDLEDLDMGGELISLNGRPMSMIVKEMLPYLSSDGRIVTSKYKRLQSMDTFARMYALLYEVTNQFEFAYRLPKKGKVQKIQVKGIKPGPMNRLFRQRYPEAAQEKPPLKVEYRDDIAILTIQTFSDGPPSRAGTPFPGFLKKTFEELDQKSIKSLVIDLRGNGGGADLNGRLLFGYLIDKPFKYYTHLEIMRNELSFLEHTEVPDLNKMLKARTKPNDKGTFNATMHPNLGDELKPMQPTFRGDVYVLLDGASFSATGETTSLMHYYKRAKFVGEECGAGYYGNTSGIMPTLTLPNTKLRIRIPMVRYHMAVSGYKYPDRGIIPEFPFARSIEDLLAGKDTELEYALELINKQRD